MRRAGFVLASLVSVGSMAFGQQTQPPLQPVGGFGGQPVKAQTVPAGGATPTGGANALPVSSTQPGVADAATLKHLEGWEGAMKGVKTFYAAATMKDQHLGMKREADFTAEMWLLKPNLARMDVVKAVPKGQQPTAADMKMYISTGKTIYVYDGAQKKRTQAALGPGGAGNNLLLDIMSGMSAKQVGERFAVRTTKQDANFVYLEVKPVYKVDKEEFETLTLVLCGPQFQQRAYIPRRVVLAKQDGQTETWDFPDPKVNPDGIKEPTFTPIDLPKGWTDEKQELPRTAPGGSPPATPGGTPRVPIPGSGK
jgi:TIGR03009 family protein